MVKQEGELKKTFGASVFNEEDIEKALKCNSDKAHYIRFKLLSQNKIIRVCRGMYRFVGKSNTFPSSLLGLRDSLLSLNKKFVLTGSSVLFNDDIHLLYVAKGSALQFEKHLEEQGYVVLVNPKYDHIQILMEKAKIEKIVVIRENNNFYSSNNHIATFEKALVDYYFEINKGQFYSYVEFGEIFETLFLNLNLSTLLKCAQLRNQKKNIISFLKKYNIEKKVKSELKI